MAMTAEMVLVGTGFCHDSVTTADRNAAAGGGIMRPMKSTLRLVVLLILAFAATPAAQAPRITAPKAEFGFNFGDDYQLATYQQLAAYWQSSIASRIGWWCRRSARPPRAGRT